MAPSFLEFKQGPVTAMSSSKDLPVHTIHIALHQYNLVARQISNSVLFSYNMVMLLPFTKQYSESNSQKNVLSGTEKKDLKTLKTIR